LTSFSLSFGKLESSKLRRMLAYLAGSGKSPAGRWCSLATLAKMLGKSASRAAWAFVRPTTGRALRRCPRIRTWIFAALTLLTNSFTFLSAARAGMAYCWYGRGVSKEGRKKA